MAPTHSKIIYGEENEHIFPKPTLTRREKDLIMKQYIQNVRFNEWGWKKCKRLGGTGEWDLIIKYCYVRNEFYIVRHYSILPAGHY